MAEGMEIKGSGRTKIKKVPQIRTGAARAVFEPVDINGTLVEKTKGGSGSLWKPLFLELVIAVA